MRPRRQGRLSRLKTIALPFALLATVAACETLGGEKPELPSQPRSAAAPRDVLAEADRARAQGRYEDASVLIGGVLKTDPNNARARLTLAEIYLATGRTPTAAAAFKDLASLTGVRPAALQGWGIALLRQGQLEAAHGALRDAVAEDPGLWRAWNALGPYYDSQSRWDEAREAYEKALEVVPDSAVVHNNLGYSLLIQQKYPEAAAQFAKALRIEPGLRVARTNLRLALAWEGKYEEAARGAGHKEMPSVLNDIGYIAILRGDLAAAEAYLARAMEASPSFNEIAWRNLRYVKSIRGAKD